MRKKYQYHSSKIPAIISVIVVYLLIITINYMTISLNLNYLDNAFNINIIVAVGMIFYIVANLFFLFQASYNGFKYMQKINDEYLEINNSVGVLIYQLSSDCKELREVKINFDNIYLIKQYKCTFINLYYYEVFYTEKDVIKKIVISISLATNLHKKIKKKVKLIKEEGVFCTKLPEPQSWLS
mgnify:CR=1 FL=1